MRALLAICAWGLTLAEPAAHPLRAAEPGLFVAVGYGGRRIVSRDGTNWQDDQRWSDQLSVDPAKDYNDVLLDITYGAGRFVAVGGGTKIGHILSSRDGRNWQAQPGLKSCVATIAFGKGRFVAARDGELMTSTTGENFQPGGQLEWKGSVRARRSACGDTEAGFRFVIIGDIDLVSEQRRVHWRGATGDGTRWDHAALETAPVHDVAYGAGHFVVVGPEGLIESSHDGQTWQQRSSSAGENFSRVVWTGSRFLVSGGKTAWSSPDGLTWTRETVHIPSHLAWAREGFLGIGISWGGTVWTSHDLVQWQEVKFPQGPALRAIVFGAP